MRTWGARMTEFSLRHCGSSAPMSCFVPRLVISMLQRAAYRAKMYLAEAVSGPFRKTLCQRIFPSDLGRGPQEKEEFKAGERLRGTVDSLHAIFPLHQVRAYGREQQTQREGSNTVPRILCSEKTKTVGHPSLPRLRSYHNIRRRDES